MACLLLRVGGGGGLARPVAGDVLCDLTVTKKGCVVCRVFEQHAGGRAVSLCPSARALVVWACGMEKSQSGVLCPVTRCARRGGMCVSFDTWRIYVWESSLRQHGLVLECRWVVVVCLGLCVGGETGVVDSQDQRMRGKQGAVSLSLAAHALGVSVSGMEREEPPHLVPVTCWALVVVGLPFTPLLLRLSAEARSVRKR